MRERVYWTLKGMDAKILDAEGTRSLAMRKKRKLLEYRMLGNRRSTLSEKMMIAEDGYWGTWLKTKDGREILLRVLDRGLPESILRDGRRVSMFLSRVWGGR